jgi:hypothetical protein
MLGTSLNPWLLLPLSCCIGCEREPVLAQTAQALVEDNSLQHQVKVVQKLSNALTLPTASTTSTSLSAAAAAPTAAAGGKAKAKAKATSVASGKQKQQQQQKPDMPCKASLVVHEIFGTDPLSEHVLPALKQVQEQLAALGAVFMPGRVRVVAAVATCPALQQHVRIANTLQPLAVPAAAAAGGGGGTAAGPVADSLSTASVTPAAAAAAATGVAMCDSANPPGSSSSSSQPVCQLPSWEVSSLLPLQPRKLEVQLSDLADSCMLLTAPQSVLELDFQQPIQLAGRRKVTLTGLEGRLSLQQWMQQQQQQPPELQSQGSPSASPAKRQELLVVSWFEADCGEGGWLSTAPGNTPLGHWQQSVEFVGHAAAVGPSSSSSSVVEGPAAGRFELQVSWNHDRVSFALIQ